MMKGCLEIGGALEVVTVRLCEGERGSENGIDVLRDMLMQNLICVIKTLKYQSLYISRFLGVSNIIVLTSEIDLLARLR